MGVQSSKKQKLEIHFGKMNLYISAMKGTIETYAKSGCFQPLPGVTDEKLNQLWVRISQDTAELLFKMAKFAEEQSTYAQLTMDMDDECPSFPDHIAEMKKRHTEIFAEQGQIFSALIEDYEKLVEFYEAAEKSKDWGKFAIDAAKVSAYVVGGVCVLAAIVCTALHFIPGVAFVSVPLQILLAKIGVSTLAGVGAVHMGFLTTAGLGAGFLAGMATGGVAGSKYVKSDIELTPKRLTKISTLLHKLKKKSIKVGIQMETFGKWTNVKAKQGKKKTSIPPKSLRSYQKQCTRLSSMCMQCCEKIRHRFKDKSPVR